MTPPLRALLLLAALLLPAGCALAPAAPDAQYRRALEDMMEARGCTGPRVDAVWLAYDRWYAVASVSPNYYLGSEADALLMQAEVFRSLQCDSLARASYEEVLRRFPDEEPFLFQRAKAARGLDTLAPPFPLPSPVTRGAQRPSTAGGLGA